MRVPSLLLLTFLLAGPVLAQPGNKPTQPYPEPPPVPKMAPKSEPARVVGNLVYDGVPEVPRDLAERMLQYQNFRIARLFDWEPRGQGLLVGTRFGETQQVHHVAQPGGARTQLTFFLEPVQAGLARPWRGPTARPERIRTGRPGLDPGLEVVLVTDVGGTENYQLLLWRERDGRSHLLTDGKSRHESPLWSRRGDKLAFVGTQRNGKDFDLYVMDPDHPEQVRRVADLQGSWKIQDWSPDDRKLLLIKYLSIEESEPWVVEVATGKMERLLADRKDKRISYGQLRWGQGGRVWLTSDEDADQVRLGRLDPDGKVTWITSHIPWKVEDVEVSPDLSRVLLAVNEEGWSRLYVLDAKGVPQKLAAMPAGVALAMRISPDGKQVAVGLTTPTSPGDVFTLPLDGKGAKTAERWTRSETGGLPESTFVQPTLVRYPTFDQVDGKPRMIPAFWYKPRKAGPAPFVLNIHGGPEGQARPWFDPTVQYWVNELGLSVLVPNVRGSDGYGKTYLGLDNGAKREDSVADIGALLDWAAKQKELDPSRAAVYGGSYGGYMVLASLATFPGKLKAGIDIVGISNFVTFLENTKAYRRDQRRQEYGDERDPKMRELLQKISPTTNAGKIRAPLFVIQGANDPRVPESEAAQIVEAVRKAGQQVWYLLAKDEGHGFQKKGNRDAMGQAVVLFWEKVLIGK